MSARWDLSAMFTQPAASAALRERTRAAMLDRFNVADERRQFSLDDAAASRADQTAQAVRRSTEPSIQAHAKRSMAAAADLPTSLPTSVAALRDTPSRDAADTRDVAGRSRTASSTGRPRLPETRRATHPNQHTSTRDDRDTGVARADAETRDRPHAVAASRVDRTHRRQETDPRQNEATGAERPDRAASPERDVIADSADGERPTEQVGSDPARSGASSRSTSTAHSANPIEGQAGAADGCSAPHEDAAGESRQAEAEAAPASTAGEEPTTDPPAEAETAPPDASVAPPQPAGTLLAELAPARTSPAPQVSVPTPSGEAEGAGAEARAVGPGGKGSRTVGGLPEDVAYEQSADGPQVASPSAEAGFSAILDAVEPPSSGGVTASGATSTAKATAAAEGTSAPAQAQSAAPPVPLGAVPMTIALRALRDTNRFEIRLDPVELGRIDVTLDIDKQAGTVSADLVVDRPATLALLQRDAGALQQALTQAGLDASAGISLSLRDGAASGQERGQDSGGGAAQGRSGQSSSGHGPQRDARADTLDPVPMRALRLSGLDIRI